ncbi:unnamed protein product [Ceutorhynchus assimilis]|uniref:Retrotransposon gag domain-containing protein n=1 Tax=Ceutorhynchus assimilis TaxID=467358 RepID=A0A9N9MW79_9CUCU|nr:unnamed protein product [Ceutorhynchus assimilis]
MDSLNNVEVFNLHGGNVGIRWQKWLKRFDNFLIAAGITSDERKEFMLLHCIGEEVFDIFLSLPDPQVPIDPNTNAPVNLAKYDKAKLKLNNHFSPKVNTEFEIFNFRQAKQSDEETIDEYYARLLKLSLNCNFPDKDREVKSQIIQGTTSTKLRRYALTENLSLNQLIAQGKAYEATKVQLNEMENNVLAENVNRVKNFSSNKQNRFNNSQTRNRNREGNI